jgi:hypothetical protein
LDDRRGTQDAVGAHRKKSRGNLISCRGIVFASSIHRLNQLLDHLQLVFNLEDIRNFLNRNSGAVLVTLIRYVTFQGYI